MVQLSDWIDLWDRESCLIKYQDTGISLHERLQKFLLEFSKLQNEAFAAQKKLCERYIIDVEKTFGTDNSYGSVLNSFIQLVQRIIDAESLVSGSFELQAIGDLKQSIDDEKKRYKRWKHDRLKLSSEMKAQTRIIDDEIKRYRDKYRDMVKANDDYAKIEVDKSHSQLDVEKARSNARLKTSDFERARKDYSAALNQFNLYRSEYFNRTLPVWAQAGHQLEKDRHVRTQTLFDVLYERVHVAADRLSAVCADLQNVSVGLDVDRDVEELISRLRTGNPPPSDIAFVDLANAQLPGVPGNNAPDSASDRSSTGAVYASSSVVLPQNFYCSVSAADFAALESAGLVDASSVGPIYAGTNSIYSAFSVTMGNGMNAISRRPSISGLTGPSSSTGHGPSLLRRFFSRRSRSVANMKMSTTAAGEADLRHDGLLEHAGQYAAPSRQPSTNDDRDLLDSSDFSDTSFESDVNHSPRDNNTNAYAATSVLTGIDRAKMNSNNNFLPTEHQRQFLPDSEPQNSDQCAVAPLAEPESLSTTPSVLRDISPSNRSLDISLKQQLDALNVPTELTNPAYGKLRNGELTNITFADHEPAPLNTSQPAQTRNDVPHNDHSNPCVRNGSSSVQSQPAAVPSLVERPNSRLPMRPPPLALNKRPSVDKLPSNSPTGPQRSPISALVSNAQNSTMGANPVPVNKEIGAQGTDSYGASTHLSSNDRRMIARKHFFARRAQVRPNGPPDTAIVVGSCTTLYPFSAEGFESCYLAFDAGEKFYTLAPSPTEDTNDWLRVLRFQTYESGYIPTAYVEQQRFSQPLILPIGGQYEDDQSSQTSSRTVQTTSRPPHSPVSCARGAKGTRMAAPSFSRISGGTRDTEL